MRRFGLVGHPLGHSFSATYFTQKFAKLGIAATYQNFDLADLSSLRQLVIDQRLSGFNVTVPYKEAVIPLLDSLDDVALAVGAVNTVAVSKNTDGSLHLRGYNTDVLGFNTATRGIQLPEVHALILGTGGAAKAVKYALSERGVPTIMVSRTERPDCYTYGELIVPVMDAGWIINCTGLGTYPNIDAQPDLPYQLLHEQQFLFDMAYNPPETAFLREGRSTGCFTMNGLSMLHAQADGAWGIWEGLGEFD